MCQFTIDAAATFARWLQLLCATHTRTHTAVNIYIYVHVCVFYSAPPLACLPAFIICKFQLFAQIRRTRSANNSNNNNNLLLLLCSTLHYYHHRLHYGKSGIALLALAPLPRAGRSCLRRSVAERQTFNSISVPRSLLVALCVCVCVPRLSANRKSHNIIYCINASRCQPSLFPPRCPA